MSLSDDDMAHAYDRLAAALDAVGDHGEAEFLRRLCLILIAQAVDRGAVHGAIDAALSGAAAPGNLRA
jgi:hypothetical protein